MFSKWHEEVKEWFWEIREQKKRIYSVSECWSILTIMLMIGICLFFVGDGFVFLHGSDAIHSYYHPPHQDE